MKENLKLSPVLILRFGLGLTFLYAGLYALLDPVAWVGFVPHWVGSLMDPNVFLTVHSAFQLVLSAAFLFGVFLPASSLIAFLDLVAILLFYGLDDLTFRDFGLAFAALALFTLVYDCTAKKERV